MSFSNSKSLLFFVSFLIICSAIHAQTTDATGNISGKVVDSLTHKAVDYATVTLADSHNKVITGTTTDSTGAYHLTPVASGTYNVIFEFIGYEPRTVKSVSVNSKHSSITLGNIALYKNANTLQAVTVTTQQKLIDNRIDKIVFNAERDLTSQGGVATDVLKKVPQVSVDADGNVQLAGSSGIRFLINGKPSSAFGSNVADVLQSIPASQIKSIEVITNPGAKYDAQGMGGIINIILKQTKVKGMNGNLSLSAGTRLENGSLNLTVRHGNFGVNGFVSGNTRLTAGTPYTSDRITVDTTNRQNVQLHQDGDNRTTRHGVESGIGFDWTVKKYNSFSGNVNYNVFGNRSYGTIQQLQQTSPFSGGGSTDIASANMLNNHFSFHSTDLSFNYKRTFAKEDQSLEFSANTSLGRSNIASGNLQTLLPQDSLIYGTNNLNAGKENETQVQLDYEQPIKKNVMFGAGGRVTFTDIASNSNVSQLQPADKSFVYDSLISNHLNYHQRVYALYSEMSFPVGKWFNAKTGLRYERTEINSYFSNAQEQVSNPGYNTWAPSLYLSRKLDENQTLKLSYSHRINRPDLGDLNPFVNTSDPKNISSGNPYLLPEIGNRYELSYNYDFNKTGSLMVTAFYRTSNHDIQPYVVFYPTLVIGDSTYTNVSVNTRENIGLEQNAGVNVFGDLHPTDKLNLRSNLFFFRRHIINGIDMGRNPTSFNYRVNMNITYQFTKSFLAEFFGNFSSARNELQGRYPSFTTYTFAARKQFWNKKGSLALTATNLFNEYVRQPTVLYGTNFTTTNVRKIPMRSIGINFTWRFGKLEFKKEKEENREMNTPEG